MKQISVFLENKPGALLKMTQALAAHEIDMRAFSLAETSDFGIARLLVDDVIATSTVLSDAGFVSSLTPVIAVEVPDVPGGLNKLLNAFNEAKVNIVYMYSCLGSKDPSKAYMLFRVSDTKTSEAALVAQGLRPLSQEELAAL